MKAFGWNAAGRRLPPGSWLRGAGARKPASRRVSLGLESLEKIELLSRGGVLPAVAALRAPADTQVAAAAVQISGTVRSTATQTTTAQSVTVPDTLTKFSLPYAPPIGLFDPNLGTLTAVRVNVTTTLISLIKSQNLSNTSPADITGFTTGNFVVSGLPAPVTGSLNGTTKTVTVPVNNGDPDFGGASTVTFPPLVVNDVKNFTFTSPSDLAFFTSSAGRTTLTPQLSETAQSGATALNGNLQTDVRTSGSGAISVTYEYTPRCPAVVKLVRFGIHHQPTQLQLSFDGPLNPADAQNPANYTVVVPNRYGSFTGPGTSTVPVVSAVYNPTANTVTLTTARQLNVHHQHQLKINLPCNDGNVITIQFGGKNSLGGFTGHRGQFIPVVRGRIVNG